jgi:uncharacterized coiled-coil protein SlyX
MMMGRPFAPRDENRKANDKQVIRELENKIAAHQSLLEQLQDKLKTDFKEYAEADANVEAAIRAISQLKQERSNLNSDYIKKLDTLRRIQSNERINELKENWDEYRTSLKSYERYILPAAIKERNEVREGNLELERALLRIEKEKQEIEALKVTLAAELSEQKFIKVAESTIDSIAYPIHVVNSTRKLLDYTAQTIITLSHIISPISLAFSGFQAMWFSYKTLTSKIESNWSKGAKVAVNMLVASFSIIGFLSAPIVALPLSMFSMCVGFFRDSYYPWMEARDDLKAGKIELIQQKQILDMTGVSIDANKKFAEEFEHNKETLTLLKEKYKHVKRNLVPIEDQQKFDLIYKTQLALSAKLKPYDNYNTQAAEHAKLVDREWVKRRELFTNIASVIGTLCCVVPFPPLQIFGVAILMTTTIIGLVQKYNLITKAKAFFKSTYDNYTNKSPRSVSDVSKKLAINLEKKAQAVPRKHHEEEIELTTFFSSLGQAPDSHHKDAPIAHSSTFFSAQGLAAGHHKGENKPDLDRTVEAIKSALDVPPVTVKSIPDVKSGDEKKHRLGGDVTPPPITKKRVMFVEEAHIARDVPKTVAMEHKSEGSSTQIDPLLSDVKNSHQK